MTSDHLSTADELLAATMLVLELGCVAFVAFVVTPRLIGLDRLMRALVWLLLVVAQGVGVPLSLGAIGLLSLPSVIVLHVALAIGALWWSRRTPAMEPDAAPPRQQWDRLLTFAAVAVGVLFFGVALYFTLRSGRSAEFDTNEYHISNLAKWLQSGSIWSLPYSTPGAITATHPGNGEMLGLWLGLPTHGDQLAYAMPLPFALLAILAASVAARELAGGRTGAAPLGALGALAVLTTPVYFFTQVDSLMTDIASAGCLVTGLALLLVARRTGASSLILLSGVAIGVGLGSKYTAFLPSLALAGAALVLLRQKRAWWWLVPGVVVFAGPWFLRNAIATGNPLFPQAVGPLRGGDSPFNLLDTPMLHHLIHRNRAAVETWMRLARSGIGPVLVLVAADPLLALRRKLPDRATALVAAAVATVALIAYLATPFSGGGPTGLAFMIISCFRYGLFAVLVGIALAAALLGRRVFAVLIAATLAWNIVKITGKYGPGRPDMLLSHKLLAAAIAGTILLTAASALLGPARLRRPEGAVRGAVAAVGLAVAIVGAFGVIHRIDDYRGTTQLEAMLLAFGPKTPAIVVGVADVRSVLGPRLDRPLIGIARGGKAREIPFVDAKQLRHRTLGAAEPPPSPELIAGFDEAIDTAGASVLVVGDVSPLSFPEGWVPSAGWCRVGGGIDGTVYVREHLLLPGAACVRATPETSPVGGDEVGSQAAPGG